MKTACVLYAEVDFCGVEATRSGKLCAICTQSVAVNEEDYDFEPGASAVPPLRHINEINYLASFTGRRLCFSASFLLVYLRADAKFRPIFSDSR